MGGEVGLCDWRDEFGRSLRFSQRFGREPAMDSRTFLTERERQQKMEGLEVGGKFAVK